MNWATTDRWADMILLAYKVGAIGPHGRAALLRKIIKSGLIFDKAYLLWDSWNNVKRCKRLADRIRPWTTIRQVYTLDWVRIWVDKFGIDLEASNAQVAGLVRASIRLQDHPRLTAELL